VERGLYVIRFDSRDAGLPTKFDQAGVPDLGALARGEGSPPYTLEDMADDAVGLPDVLDVRKTHICGASMGGMIAQTIAIRHPFCLKRPCRDGVILAASSSEQWEANLRSLDGELAPEVVEAVDRAWQKARPECPQYFRT